MAKLSAFEFPNYISDRPAGDGVPEPPDYSLWGCDSQLPQSAYILGIVPEYPPRRMSWSLKFDEPIELAKGKPLRTLRDAAEHITALPRAVAELEHWQTAMACLIAAAEKRGIVMIARIAVVQALQAGKPQTAPSLRKRSAKKYRLIR